MNPIVQQALDRFRVAADAEDAQRTREVDDLKFQIPEMQWPDDAKAQRGATMVNGVPIPPRPMLSIPKLDQPIQLVLNQERQAHLGITIHALDEDADDDTADVMQGLYRRIEVDSRADLARSWAFDRAVKAGRGFYRVLTEPDPSGTAGDQRIVIKRILYQASVYLDPFATEPDWCDGGWGIIAADLPFSRYKKQHPKSELANVGDDEFRAVGDDAPGWTNGEGEARTVRIAEYFEKTYDADGTATGVKWYKINALEILDEGEWNGTYIPIIPVIGRELQPFSGERRWTGIIGPAKDGQRLFNYAASAAVEIAALEPKAPWLLAEGQEEGHEDEFLLSNVRNFPYIRYKPKTIGGELAPAPDRVRVDTSRLGPSMELLQQADSFIQAATTTIDQSAIENMAKRKVAHQTINAVQQQSDYGTSHYIDNLATISMTYEAKVVLDAMAKVYDREGRPARTLSQDNQPGKVLLNQPYVEDPQSKQLQPVPAGTPKAKHYDLKKGKYGVVVSVGKSYQTKAQQGSDALGQVFQAAPQLIGLLGDIYMQFQDFPGHQEAAERLKRMLPPQARGDEQGQPDPQQLQAKMQHMGQMIDLLTKELNARTDQIKTEQAKYDAQAQIEQLKNALTLELQRMKDATTIEVAKINALAKGVIAAGQAEDEAIALHKEMAHDVGMAAMAQTHALQQGQQAAQQGQDQSAQDHQEALDQGQQSADNTLAAQQQQADLAPQPEAGAGA